MHFRKLNLNPRVAAGITAAGHVTPHAIRSGDAVKKTVWPDSSMPLRFPWPCFLPAWRTGSADSRGLAFARVVRTVERNIA